MVYSFVPTTFYQTKAMSNTEKVTINYDVLSSNDEVLRTHKISGTFPTDWTYTDMIDDLIEKAYEKEMAKASWRESYSILEEC